MVKDHAGGTITTGALHYLLETLLADEGGSLEPGVRRPLEVAFAALREGFKRQVGNYAGFPERGDPQDSVYLPLVRGAERLPPARKEPAALPTISVVMPSLNQARFLGRALDSAIGQAYPGLELLV